MYVGRGEDSMPNNAKALDSANLAQIQPNHCAYWLCLKSDL